MIKMSQEQHPPIVFRKYDKDEWDSYTNITATCLSLYQKRQARVKKESANDIDDNEEDDEDDEDKEHREKRQMLEAEAIKDEAEAKQIQATQESLRTQWCMLLRELWGDFYILRLFNNNQISQTVITDCNEDRTAFIIGALTDYIYSNILYNQSYLEVVELLTPEYHQDKKIYLTSVKGSLIYIKIYIKNVLLYIEIADLFKYNIKNSLKKKGIVELKRNRRKLEMEREQQERLKLKRTENMERLCGEEESNKKRAVCIEDDLLSIEHEDVETGVEVFL